jgi:cytochrome c-type biogenesis protein CcmF
MIIVFTTQHFLSLLGITLAVWLVAGSLWVLWRRVRGTRKGWLNLWNSLCNVPRAVLGMVLSHLGLGIVVGAVSIVSAWQSENISSLSPGQHIELAGYRITFENVRNINVDNYESETGIFAVTRNGSPVTTLSAERRFFPVQQSQTSHSSIYTNLVSNLYISLGESNGKGAWTVRAFHHPAAPLLWIGGFIMALGGFVSLSDRRFRVAVAPRQPLAVGSKTAEGVA